MAAPTVHHKESLLIPSPNRVTVSMMFFEDEIILLSGHGQALQLFCGLQYIVVKSPKSGVSRPILTARFVMKAAA